MPQLLTRISPILWIFADLTERGRRGADPGAVVTAVDAAEELLAGYRPMPGVYDEMMAPDGRLRDHWQRLIGAVAALGPEERRQREQATARLLRDSGIAFNVHADPDDPAQAGQLDTLPLVMASADWRHLAAGLIQRARLLEARPGRPLQHREPAPGKSPAAGPGVRQRGFSAALGAPRGPQAPEPAALRRRRRAHRRRPLAGARRPDRDAVRHRRGGRRPGRALARLCRAVPRLPGPAPGRLLPVAARRSVRHAGSRRRPGGPAGARALRSGLFQPRLHRPLSRLHPGRGRRSHGARRPGVPEDAGRPAAGRPGGAPRAGRATATRSSWMAAAASGSPA